MMIAQILLGIIGLSSGFIVAGGVIALMVGLGIITRYAGITHTGSKSQIYENFILLGALAGNMMTVYKISVPLGNIGLGVMGLCFGIFVGGWIMALAEIVNIFPVFSRRLGLVKGMSILVISIALEKITGSMIHFYKGW